MNLTSRHEKFVRGRRRSVRSGWLLAVLASLGYIVLLAWLALRAPMFTNPVAVLERLEAGSLESSTQILMAGLLPVVVLLLPIVVAALLLAMFAAFGLERKYHAITDTLTSSGDRE